MAQADQEGGSMMVEHTEPPQSHVRGPESPSRLKAQASGAKTNGEKSGRKSVGNQEADDGSTAKPVKAVKSKADETTIDDLLLPRSLVSRLARGSLPPNTSLQKDALLALTKSATVFISYLAHTANSVTSRKTIQAGDVLEAIREIELSGVMGSRLEEEIKLFDDGVKGKRKGYRDRVKARESTGKTDAEDGDTQIEEEREERGPQNKRVRRMGDDDEEPSAQLLAEAAQAGSQGQRNGETNGHDGSDAENAGEGEGEDDEEDEDEDEDEPDDEQDEEGENEEDEERVAEDTLGVDEEERDRRKKSELLAPNGRMEVASDEESD